MIGAGMAGNEMVIAVEDEGCGVPAADLDRIFETFTRVNPGGRPRARHRAGAVCHEGRRRGHGRLDPLGVGELVARLRTARRHAVQIAGTRAVVTAGDLVIDTLAHRVTLRGEPVRLTPKKYDLLHLLTRHAGPVLAHAHILREVWGRQQGDQAQYLRVFIGRLRQKVEADPADPRLLVNEPGIGCRLAIPPERADDPGQGAT